MKYILGISLIAVAALFACASAMPSGVIYPSIEPDRDVTGTLPVSASFTFEGEQVTVATEVDAALYAGALSADKTVTRFGDARKDDWIEDYFPAFVDDPDEAGFYDALIAEFRRIRDERGLDADRYAELMTCYAQSIAYYTDPSDLEPKFPVETFVDGNGDCDDKALLLSALLSHEGYDVAILLFEPEKHVALGIRCDELDYRGTGYAYVETTTEGFIGTVPDAFSGGVKLTSQPLVLAIGDGTLEYTAGDEVTEILRGSQQAHDEASSLADAIARMDVGLRGMEAETRAARQRLESAHSQGCGEACVRLAERYNQLVAAYDAELDARNTMAERHNRLLAVGRKVLEGHDDRARTFASLFAQLP